MSRDPQARGYGFRDLDDAFGGDPDVTDVVEQLDVQRPGAVEAHRRIVEAERGALNTLPPPQRFNDLYPIFPTRIILPNPELWPGKTPRKYHLTVADDGVGNAFQGQVNFANWCSIYQISACARVTEGADTWLGRDALSLFFVTLQRSQGDSLTFGGQTPQGLLGAFFGTGDSPNPIGGDGWAFEANQSLVINGTCIFRSFNLTLCFDVIESIPRTNVGMSRTPAYTRDR